MSTFFLAYEATSEEWGTRTTTKGYRIFKTTAETPEDIADALEERLNKLSLEFPAGSSIIATAFNRI